MLRTVFASQWQVLVIAALSCISAAEMGFRVGLSRTHDEGRKAVINSIQGAILGLLALLLGFTFAMAAGRYDYRRSLVLEEANAIGTTYLRASLLDDQNQREVQRLLREYVAARLDFYSAGADQPKQATAEVRAAKLQRELWSHAEAAAASAPTPIVATFITALNETIDLDAARLFALHAHVPGAVWLLLSIVTLCACYACGYGAGTSGVRSQFPSLIVPLLIAVVINLIADLDRPRGGLIGISQEPMTELQRTLAGPTA